MQHIYDSLSMTKSDENFQNETKTFAGVHCCEWPRDGAPLWVWSLWKPSEPFLLSSFLWFSQCLVLKGIANGMFSHIMGQKHRLIKKSGILNIQWFSTKCFEPWKFCNKFQIPDRGLSAMCCSLKTQRCKTLVKGSCWGRPRGLLRMGRTWTSRSRPGGATRFDTKLIYFFSIPLSPGIPVAPRKSPLVNWKWRNRNSTRRGEGELQQEQLQGHLEGRHQVGEWTGAKAEWK